MDNDLTMKNLRLTCIATLISLILGTFDIVTSDTSIDSTVSESAVSANDVLTQNATESLMQHETTKLKLTSNAKVGESIHNDNGATPENSGTKEKIRMVTKEELALHDGKQTPTVWLSIMANVFDVSAGPEYYSEDGPYRVFVARDGNVPFVSGVFNAEEAEKPLSSLKPHELSNLEHWLQFYVDEDKYPFIGLLEGSLYDKDGNPTEEMKLVQDKIAFVKANVENRQKKTANIIERRKKEDEERKKAKKKIFEEMKKQKIRGETSNLLSHNLFSSVWQFFQGKRGSTNSDVEL